MNSRGRRIAFLRIEPRQLILSPRRRILFVQSQVIGFWGGFQPRDIREMRITTRSEGSVLVIGLQGKIMGDPEITDILDTVKSALFNNQQKVVMDLGGVDWINSSGLGSLIAAQGLMREVEGELRLAALSDSVRSAMTINKLNLVFDFHPTVEAAAASFR